MKRILIITMLMVPLGAIANTCPAAAPISGCSCPAGVTAVRAGACNAGEVTVVQGNCTGCNFASGGGNLTFGI